MKNMTQTGWGDLQPVTLGSQIISKNTLRTEQIGPPVVRESRQIGVRELVTRFERLATLPPPSPNTSPVPNSPTVIIRSREAPSFDEDPKSPSITTTQCAAKDTAGGKNQIVIGRGVPPAGGKPLIYSNILRQLINVNLVTEDDESGACVDDTHFVERIQIGFNGVLRLNVTTQSGSTASVIGNREGRAPDIRAGNSIVGYQIDVTPTAHARSRSNYRRSVSLDEHLGALKRRQRTSSTTKHSSSSHRPIPMAAASRVLYGTLNELSHSLGVRPKPKDLQIVNELHCNVSATVATLKQQYPKFFDKSQPSKSFLNMKQELLENPVSEAPKTVAFVRNCGTQ